MVHMLAKMCLPILRENYLVYSLLSSKSIAKSSKVYFS